MQKDDVIISTCLPPKPKLFFNRKRYEINCLLKNVTQEVLIDCSLFEKRFNDCANFKLQSNKIAVVRT